MKPFLAMAVMVGAAAVSGQVTIPPVVFPPMTSPVGTARPTAKPPLTLTPKAGPAAEISGRVVDDGARAVADATVWLLGPSSLQRAVTDARGRFLFAGVASGEYVVVARKGGFYDGAFGKTRPAGFPLPIAVAAGQAASDLQIDLFRAGVIEGTVLDEANDPVVGARVEAIRRFRRGGDWHFVAAGTAMTDDGGRYRIHGLEPGEYIVTTPTAQLNVGVPDERLAAGGVPLTESRDLAYPTLYYSATRHSLLSLPILIGSGEVRYAVNFRWSPVPAHSVSGRLVGEAMPSGVHVVRLVPVDTREIGIASEAAITFAAPDGSFLFERVPAGEYRLEAGGAFGPPRIVEAYFPEGVGQPSHTHWGSGSVTVLDEDVHGLEVELRIGRPASGTVSAPAGIEWSRVSIAIVPAVPGLSRATAPRVVNGDFQTSPLVPGDYDVRVTGLPPGLYLEGISVNGQDALDEPARLGGSDDSGISITLTSHPTTIAGAVRDARMQPASGAAILVLPATASRWSPNRTRQARASMNGQFAITGLPPGDYLIVAVDDALAEGWQDEPSLAQLRTLGTRLSLREQDTRTLQLRLSTMKR